MTTRTVLLLARHADAAWRAAIRPWLEQGRGRVERAYVIVATRGQAHGLKQRCLEEGLPLFGVEFLTPGLARKKWLALERAGRPALGRELLLLQLRTLIARRLRAAEPGADGHRDPERGFWQSLQSDAERALDDFDDLLKAGFRAADFPVRPLREIFGELARWVDERGYALAAAQAAGAANTGPRAAVLGSRVLVYGLGADLWGEFFNVAAFVRRCAHVTAVLPEPEFGGRTEHDEKWIELWETLLGTDATPLDVEEPAGSCQPVAEVWRREAAGPVPARLLVGRTRGDEMKQVANAVGELLQAGGATRIAVVFPRSDAAHLELVRLLTERGVPFADVLETAAPPALEVQAQHALLAVFEKGGRIEELLALWPLLRALGAVSLSLAAARRACERSFDLRQTHAIAPQIAEWERGAPELARVARGLGSPWPGDLPLSAALAQFRAACDALDLEPPEGWGALDRLAAADPEPKPLAVVTAALRSFLATSGPVAGAPGRGAFARVTLTTRWRAEGLAWSHLILVESNARVWPERREPGCWLTDEHRAALNTRRRYPLGLFTADDWTALERAGYARLVRDTAREVIFSAALLADDDPELKLAPNGWVERIMLANALVPGGDLERGFAELAAVGATAAEDTPGLAAWGAVWRRRRDPAAAFDEFFFGGDPAKITPEMLPARLIERGVQDPAELWFEAVLKTRRVPWAPFLRARRKALGQYAHALLAEVLTPDAATNGFGPMPAIETTRTRLAAALEAQRRCWPANAYWDSFYGELAHVCRSLLANLAGIPAGSYVATEAWLPAAACLELGDRKVPVHGRLDLVRLDQPSWAGAEVDIVDFKTGGDPELSAGRMARSGASLQLGVYLAAARSLGIRGGRVWMIKPPPGAVTQLAFEDMALALTKLQWLGQALARGVYGALTRDRSDYAPSGCDWPLACTPIAQAILARKFAVTFGVGPEEALDE